MENAIVKSLELMLLGMVGIFVVLVLIYFVIVMLNKFTNKPNEKVKAEAEAIVEEDESVSTVDDTEDEIVCAIVQSVICEELHVEPNKIQIVAINEK